MSSDFDELDALARRSAPGLVGLSRDTAEAELDPRLSIRFAAEGAPVTMEYRFGRITATVRAGVVIAAVAG